MPASHSATTEIPRSSPRLCQRLVDVHTRCNAPIARRHVCKAHIQAYEESHERYKDAANDARALSASARLKRSEVGQLGRAEVEDRIVDIGAYIDALEREKLLRKEHDWTFVGEPDEGHRTRLQKIEQQLEHSRDIIHMLRSRRGRLERNSRGQPCRARSAILPEQPPASEAGSSSRSPRHRNRRRGDEERGAQSRAAARKRLSKERERQHVVVIEANGHASSSRRRASRITYAAHWQNLRWR
ncbi:hypothetical protein C8T65DRAFT_64201 [Cerioporus squamosus]|nr:hypothetical protein C8T65DRAFT_64201 [Cerioporus squamosus]